MSSSGAIRTNERFPIKVSVEIAQPRAQRRSDAELCDLSTGGCRIISRDPFAVGDQILLTIDGLEPWPAAIVWSGDGCAGDAFHTPLVCSIADPCPRAFR